MEPSTTTTAPPKESCKTQIKVALPDASKMQDGNIDDAGENISSILTENPNLSPSKSDSVIKETLGDDMDDSNEEE